MRHLVFGWLWIILGIVFATKGLSQEFIASIIISNVWFATK